MQIEINIDDESDRCRYNYRAIYLMSGGIDIGTTCLYNTETEARNSLDGTFKVVGTMKIPVELI